MRASLLRRTGALAIDWFASLIVAATVFTGWTSPGLNSAVLAVFGVEVFVLTSLRQGSFGQLLTGIRIRRLDGQRAGVGAIALRTALICLVLPAAFTGPDGRGFHDRAAGTEPVLL